jgi:hypothetical protein
MLCANKNASSSLSSFCWIVLTQALYASRRWSAATAKPGCGRNFRRAPIQKFRRCGLQSSRTIGQPGGSANSRLLGAPVVIAHK